MSKATFMQGAQRVFLVTPATQNRQYPRTGKSVTIRKKTLTKEQQIDQMFMEKTLCDLNSGGPVVSCAQAVLLITSAAQKGYRVYISDRGVGCTDFGPIKFPLRYKSAKNSQVIKISMPFEIGKEAMKVLHEMVSNGIIVMKCRKRRDLKETC